MQFNCPAYQNCRREHLLRGYDVQNYASWDEFKNLEGLNIARMPNPRFQGGLPMRFVQAPSPTQQILVNYNGIPALQGLSIVRGPIMYPLTHSIPSPFQQNFINANRCFGPFTGNNGAWF